MKRNSESPLTDSARDMGVANQIAGLEGDVGQVERDTDRGRGRDREGGPPRLASSPLIIDLHGIRTAR